MEQGSAGHSLLHEGCSVRTKGLLALHSMSCIACITERAAAVTGQRVTT